MNKKMTTFMLVGLAFGMNLMPKPASAVFGTFNPTPGPGIAQVPACTLCMASFANSFSLGTTGVNYSAFGIAFMPSGKVLVSDTAPGTTSQMYIFPEGLTDTATQCANGGATAPAGYFAPNYPQLSNLSNLSSRGVADMTMTFDGRIFGTGADPSGNGMVFPLTYSAPIFTSGASIVMPRVGGAAGIATDSVSGYLFVVLGNQLFLVNPNGAPGSEVSLASGFTQADGVTFAVGDPTNPGDDAVYVADLGAGTFVRFAITRNPAGVPVSVASGVKCTGIANPDGAAVGLLGSCMAGHVVVNDNSGILTITSDGAGATACQTLFSGGSRGDFVKVGGNGWAYVTQSDSIALLRDLANAPLFTTSAPMGCDSLIAYATQLKLNGCLTGNAVLAHLGNTCPPNSGNPAFKINQLSKALDELCKNFGTGSAACKQQIAPLMVAVANALQLANAAMIPPVVAPAQTFIDGANGGSCAGQIIVPVLP